MMRNFFGSSENTLWRLALTLVAAKAFLCIGYSAEELDPDLADTSCLKVAPNGCMDLKTAEECLKHMADETGGTSSDGLEVERKRCVWCGGVPCGKSWYLCEPDDLQPGTSQRFFAGCKNGRPAAVIGKKGYAVHVPGYTPPATGPEPLVPSWVPKRPETQDMHCLKPVKSGCRDLKTMAECQSSKDDSGIEFWKENRLRIKGEPCVWCGGELCTEKSLAMCEPFDYLMYGKGSAFNIVSAPSLHVAGCHGHIPLPEFDYTCLEFEPKGCQSLTTPHACLRSKDGRKDDYQDGRKIHGQPCVWCGGIPCVAGGLSLCEPFDWVINGEHQAFQLFVPKYTFRIAACTYSRPFPHSYYGPTEYNPGMLIQVQVPPQPSSPAPVRKALQVVALEKEVRRHMGLECWDKCGQQAGYCEWCGNGNACCRQGWSQDPPECSKSGNHSTARHECTTGAKAGVGGGAILPRPPAAFGKTGNSLVHWIWLLAPLLVVLTAVPVVLLCCIHGWRKTSCAMLLQEGWRESKALVRACEASDRRSQEITDDPFSTLGQD